MNQEIIELNGRLADELLSNLERDNSFLGNYTIMIKWEHSGIQIERFIIVSQFYVESASRNSLIEQFIKFINREMEDMEDKDKFWIFNNKTQQYVRVK